MTTSETPRDVIAPETIAPIAPCEHMTDLVSALADGSLSGPGRWYTLFHVATCKRCKPALEALRQLRTANCSVLSGMIVVSPSLFGSPPSRFIPVHRLKIQNKQPSSTGRFALQLHCPLLWRGTSGQGRGGD
jgi:hypothetical protein